jgi:hypothetical protein
MTALLSFVAAAGVLLQLSSTRFQAIEELRIGSSDAPEYEFTVIRTAVVGRDANLYLLLPREQEIRVFSPAGRFLRRIGRPGQGPGEFESPTEIGWRADTLWVRDADLGRVTFFDAEGRVGRALTARMPAVGGNYVTGPPAAILADGSLLGVGDAPSMAVASGRFTRVPMVRFDESGAGPRIMRELSLEHAYGTVPPSPKRPGVHFVQRLGDAPLWDVAADGSGIVVVDREAATDGRTAQLVVTVYAPSGDVRVQRRIEYAPVPVSRAFRDSVVRRTLNPKGLPDFEYQREAVYTPDFRPPVTQVMLAKDGRVWLRREFGYGAEVDWDVLDRELRPAGVVRLPTDFRAFEATVNALWGSRVGEDDVPYLVRYRLSKPGV